MTQAGSCHEILRLSGLLPQPQSDSFLCSTGPVAGSDSNSFLSNRAKSKKIKSLRQAYSNVAQYFLQVLHCRYLSRFSVEMGSSDFPVRTSARKECILMCFMKFVRVTKVTKLYTYSK